MPGVNLTASLSIKGALTGSADLGTPKMRLADILETLELVPGTASTVEADLLFSDTRTLAASGTEDLDLAGVLENAFGEVVNAAEVVLIFIKAAAGNTNDVQVTRSASNGFPGPFLAAGDGLAIAPGDYQLFSSRDGWAVTAGTGDLITITNSAGGTSVDYDIIVVGRSVAA